MLSALAALRHGVAKRTPLTATLHPSPHTHKAPPPSSLPEITVIGDAAGSNLLAPKRSCSYKGDKERQSQASSDGRLRWEKPYFRLIVPTDAYTQVQGEEKDINLNITNP